MFEKASSFQLILDLRCNCNCIICGASWPFRPNLSTKEAIDRLQLGIDIGLLEVVFSGGEATLRSDLLELIQIACKIGYTSVILLSNGRCLSDITYLDALAQAGVTGIGVSLHGHTVELHEQITQTPGSFEQTVEGITTLQYHLPGVPLSVNYVICGTNYRFTKDIISFLVQLKVRLIQVTYVVPVGRAIGIYYMPTMPSMSEALPYVRDGVSLFMKTYRKESNASISLAFFPYCILRDLVIFSGDISQSESYFATEIGEIIPVDTEISRQQMKIKRTKCIFCSFYSHCDGVWKEYIDAKGWAEFEPIVDYDPELIIRSIDCDSMNSNIGKKAN
jgi:MoaA/NifB/PqqE/SkfB family radical SAM enzyme